MITEYFHGARSRTVTNSPTVPIVAPSGITFAVGTAPAHTVANGAVQEPVMCSSFSGSAARLGNSEDWPKYTLCEVQHSHFKHFSTAPVFMVNVLDPAKHKKAVAAKDHPIAGNRVLLPLEALKDTVKIENSKAGEDYDLFYEGENLVLEVIETGNLATATEASISYDAVDPSMVTPADIIGGFDVATKKSTGLELLSKVFPTFGILPDLAIAPGWSHHQEVAAALAAKADMISALFEAKALVDVDTIVVKHYGDAPTWKKEKKITSKTQSLCYPMCKAGERVFHLSSLAAALIAKVDSDNDGCPSESPSNKPLMIDATVVDGGKTEERLDITEANYLNANGIITALNFMDGFVLWGNEMACYPESKDVKERFISVSRMFSWVANSLILAHWAKVDGKMTRRLIDSIVDSANIWLNGLTSAGHILGGRVEYRADENPADDLEAGKSRYHIFLTPAGPAQEIEFILEYDQQYVTMSLAAA